VQCDATFHVRGEQLDARPFLLKARVGTVELRAPILSGPVRQMTISEITSDVQARIFARAQRAEPSNVL
jgi:hypothetical protein